MALPKAALVNGNTHPGIRITPPAWMEDSECQKADSRLFHKPEGRYGMGEALEKIEQERVKDAKTYCARCPVIAECLKFAQDSGDTWAIMGGLTPNERRRLGRRKDGIAAS